MQILDKRSFIGNNISFRKATKWKPEYTFEQTMNDLLEYWRHRVNSGRRFLRR